MTLKNIVLIGFMGSGKSKTAECLSKALNREVLSTDELIEKKEGKTIAEIFEQAGEDYFRGLERMVVKEVSGREGVIIDCGGGVIVNPDNLAHLKEKGILIYLAASARCIYGNIKEGKQRPLMNVDDPQAVIEQLLEERREFYEKADITVDSDFRPIDQIANDILKVLNNDRN